MIGQWKGKVGLEVLEREKEEGGERRALPGDQPWCFGSSEVCQE